MTTPTMVDITKIVMDQSLYARYKGGRAVASQYAEQMDAGAEFPPLIVDQRMRLIDGWHRLQAWKNRGMKKVPVELVRVKDDADFFKRALTANAAHGERYTHIDYAHMVLRGRELGIPETKIAELVHVTPGFLDVIVRDWFGYNGSGQAIALKSTIKHMRGQTLTSDQIVANGKLSGMRPDFYMNQVMLLLDNNLLDPENAKYGERLNELEESIRLYRLAQKKRRRA